jgi:hypothetical protein
LLQVNERDEFNKISIKKSHSHHGDKNKCQVEEFKMKLKRRIEDSRQAVKRIYRKEILLLSTASPQITQIAPVVHE